jgi:hypothetical protein
MNTLEERRHQEDMGQVFKMLSGHDRADQGQWLMMEADGTVNTRQAAGPRNLVKPGVNLDVRTNFFSVRVVDTWDAIPTDIKMAEDLRKFLKNVQEPQMQLQGSYRC